MVYRGKIKIPHAVVVDFRILSAGVAIHQGSFQVTDEPGHSVIGSQQTSVASQDPRVEVSLFSGLIVEHEFGVRGVRLYFHLYEVVERRQIVLMEAPLEIPFDQTQSGVPVPLDSGYSITFHVVHVNLPASADN